MSTPVLFRSRREQLEHDTGLAIRYCMIKFTGRVLLLAEVIVQGKQKWRNASRRAFAGFAFNDEVADRLFAYFELAFEQKMKAPPGTALFFAKQLIQMAEVKSPPTQAQIDRAWTVESNSSPEGREQFYGGRHPAEILESVIKGVH